MTKRDKLSDAKLRAIKGSGKLQKITDGEGLSVRVSPDGKTKTFSYAYRVTGFRIDKDGKRVTGKDGKVERAIGFGNYPAISLAQAREMHKEAQKLVALDKCPAQAKKDAAEERRREAQNGDGSFRAFAERWIEHNEPRWAPKYLARVKGLMKNDIYPVIGTMKLGDVQSDDVIEIVLNKKAAPTAAAKARQLVREVYDWAIANKHAKTNPGLGLKVRQVIHIPKAKHHQPMTELELGAFWRGLVALEDGETQPSSIAAARFLTLTGVRKGEAIGAEWSEFSDLDGAEPLWIVPASRMKMREAHKVPLSTQAVALLQAQEKLTGGRRYVFASSTKATPLAACTLNAMWGRLQGMRADLTVHATRSTIATILREHNFDRDVVELILAHSERGTASAYHFPELLTERREALQYYANLVDKVAAGANVIPLKRREQKAA